MIESFKLINLSSDEEPVSEVADVLSKSLIEKKLTFVALLKQLHNLSNLSKDQSRDLLLNILSSIQNKRSDRELKDMITTEQHKSILNLISNEESQQKDRSLPTESRFSANTTMYFMEQMLLARLGYITEDN